MAMQKLFSVVNDRDPMEFWKSAPYLPHFMRGYTVKRRLNEEVCVSQEFYGLPRLTW